jgi:DNA-directed RNA polymerase subunit N (RpoN/RPB10)
MIFQKRCFACGRTLQRKNYIRRMSYNQRNITPHLLYYTKTGKQSIRQMSIETILVWDNTEQ